MSKTPTPKNDQIRALREAKYMASLAPVTPGTRKKLVKAIDEAAARSDAAHARKAKRKSAKKARATPPQ